MLPLDILIYLMAHFETRSALFQYAITCRSLYKASPPYLLAHSNTISSLFRLSSFCEFVLTDFPNRCRMLTNLHLLLWDSDYDKATLGQNTGLLVKVLSNATNLAELVVLSQFHLRQYLELEPEVLGDLFATSTKLKNIELHSAEKTDTFRCLRTTTAPLTDLYLSFDTLEHDAWVRFSTELLAPFSNTLTTLTIHRAIIEHSDVILPNVYTLALQNHAQEDFSLKALLSSFPSVQNLDVDARFIGVWPEQWSRAYESNRFVDSSSVWANMSSTRGDLNSLFVLGLSSPSFHVEVRDFSPLRPDHEKLSAILHNLRPRHLLLSFVHTTYHSNHLVEKFKKPPVPIIAVVNGEIIVLDFTLTLEGANDSPLILLDVYTWVRMVKAPYLILNITIDAGTDRSPPYNGETPPPSPVEIQLPQAIDIYSVALKMVQENSSIQYLSITMGFHGTDQYVFLENFWRVLPNSVLEELPVELALRLEDSKEALDAINEIRDFHDTVYIG
ncbi:hypothetical protein C8Q75DRAFT_805742 [Abortiporus biennis]|nr:hypothetical protein C8Q75DRAFT_805742 [Abortiporus biennis]